MWNLIETLLLVACVVGCGTAPPAELTVGQIVSDPPSDTKTPGQTITPAVVSPSTTPSSNPTVSLVFYQLTTTKVPDSSHPSRSYTATGYCTVYQANTYCWDDGIKHLTNGPILNYTYWNESKSNPNNNNYFGNGRNWSWCFVSGAVQDDLLAQPILMTNNIVSDMTFYGGASVPTPTKVLAQGSPTNVSCSLDNGILDCGTVQIDTNQTPL